MLSDDNFTAAAYVWGGDRRDAAPGWEVVLPLLNWQFGVGAGWPNKPSVMALITLTGPCDPTGSFLEFSNQHREETLPGMRQIVGVYWFGCTVKLL